MRLLPIIIFLTIVFNCDAQQEQAWLEGLENDQLRPENEVGEYANLDFSTLLIPRREFLGFIGDGYKRIYIYFTSINRNAEDKYLYHVKGISIVGNNKTNFEGTIRLNQVRQFKTFHYGIDDEYKNDGIKAQGLLIGVYEFMEDNKASNSGVFSGILTNYWLVDKHGVLKYDNIEWFSDRYRNNQFIGKWTPYKSKINKICNWGERRIPFSGDLDIGAGEFSPNPKYSNVGWADYKFR